MTDNNFNFPLIDTKGFEKPAVTLIEKASDAVGRVYADLGRAGKFLYEHIRAGSNEQSALNSYDVSNFSKQALDWDVANKVREYKNVSEILSQAAIQLPLNASEEKIHQMKDDWIVYVMKKAAMVSDATMQKVWAKVISGEAENPGRFSRQAVDIVGIMDKKAAELFTVMGQFVTDETPSSKRILLIFGLSRDVYTKQGINYEAILYLQSLGLVHYWERAFFVYYNQPEVLLRYGDSSVELLVPLVGGGRHKLHVGEVLLTPVGREVLSLAEPERNPEFWEQAIKQMEKDGREPRLVEK